MTQPREPLVQLWLAAVHATAAGLALAWGATHLIAVRYHLDRLREPEDDTYAAALERMRR